MRVQRLVTFALAGITIAFCCTEAIGHVAADTAVVQHIFPMDCVFNEVNDGSATYTFLTPAACGVLQSGPANQVGQADAQLIATRTPLLQRGGLQQQLNTSTYDSSLAASSAKPQGSDDLVKSPLIAKDVFKESKRLQISNLACIMTLLLGWLLLTVRRRYRLERGEVRH